MKTITFLLAFAFGIFFLWYGIGKVKEPIAFAVAIRNFQLIGDPYAVGFAYLIPWVETFAGIAVITQRFRKGGASLLTILLLVFTGAILISWMRGLDISCGCFGDDTPMNYPVKVAQNACLIAVGIFLWWSAGKKSFVAPSA